MADLQVNVKGQTSDLDQALEKTKGKVGKLGSKLESTGSKLSKSISAPAGAAAAAVGGLAVKAGRAADRLLDISEQTGLTTKSIQEFQAVADKAGVSTNSITGAAEMLNQRMRQLDSDSSNASKAFEELGIQTKTQGGALRDNSAIFQEAVNKLSDLENQTQRNKLASQLFGNRWSELAPVLGMGSAEIEKAKNKAGELGQVMSKDQIKAANKFRQSYDSITSSLNTLLNKMGAELAPILQDTIIPIFKNRVIPAFQSAVKNIRQFAEMFTGLPGPIKQATVAVTGLALALPPVAMGAGKILRVAPKAFRAMAASAKISAAATRRALMSTGIGALAVAIGYGVTKAIEHWDKLKGVFEGTGLIKVFEKIGGVIKDSMEIAVGAFMVAKKKVNQAIEAIKGGFERNMGGIKTVVKGVVSFVVDGFKDLWSRVKTVFNGVVDIIGSAVGMIKKSMEFWYDLFTDDITGAFNALEDALKYMVLGVVNAVDTMISTIIETIASFVSYIDRAFGTDMAGALDSASDKVSSFADDIKTKLGLNEQQKNIDKTTNSLKSMGQTLESVGSKTLDFGGSGDDSSSGGDSNKNTPSKAQTKTGGEGSKLTKNEQDPGMANIIPEEQLKQQLNNVEKAMAKQRIAEIWEGVGNRISAAGEAMSKSFTKQAKMAGQSAKSMAQFAAQLGNAVSDSISAFIAEGVTAVVSGALKSSSLLGPAAVPIAASAGAAAQALFSSIVPEFAQGGGVQGETLAKLGDYPGSYANPEVAMRMDQVQRMMDQPQSSGGQDVEFVLDGEKLKGVQNSNSNRKRRMGL